MSKKVRRLLVAADILILTGGLIISLGVGLLNTAAGVITLGALSIAAGIFINRGASH